MDFFQSVKLVYFSFHVEWVSMLKKPTIFSKANYCLRLIPDISVIWMKCSILMVGDCFAFHSVLNTNKSAKKSSKKCFSAKSVQSSKPRVFRKEWMWTKTSGKHIFIPKGYQLFAHKKTLQMGLINIILERFFQCFINWRNVFFLLCLSMHSFVIVCLWNTSWVNFLSKGCVLFSFLPA